MTDLTCEMPASESSSRPQSRPPVCGSTAGPWPSRTSGTPGSTWIRGPDECPAEQSQFRASAEGPWAEATIRCWPRRSPGRILASGPPTLQMTSLQIWKKPDLSQLIQCLKRRWTFTVALVTLPCGSHFTYFELRLLFISILRKTNWCLAKVT